MRRVGSWTLTLLVPMLGACFEDTQTQPTTGAASDEGTTGSGSTSVTSTSEPASTSETTAADTVITGADTTADGSTGAASCPEECFTGQCDEQGRCVRVVFVTSDVYDAQLGTPAVADGLCAEEADKAGLSGAFAAFVATDGVVSAFERVHISDDPNAVFVLAGPGGAVVGDVAQLRPDLDPLAELDHPIELDATGSPIDPLLGTACSLETAGQRVWTGLINDADTLALGSQCGSWDGTGPNVATGRLNLVGLGWAGATNCPCEDPEGVPTLARFYCFEVPAG